MRSPTAKTTKFSKNVLAFLLGITLASVSSGVLAQAEVSDEDLAAAKREGRVIGRSLQGLPKLDASGNVVTDASGKPVMQGSSSSQSQAYGEGAETYLGVTGVKTLARPTSRNMAAGASGTLTGHVDFLCTLSPGTQSMVAGRTVQFNGCQVEAGVITAVNIQLCSATLNGQYCTPDTFTPPADYPANAFSVIDGASVGIGCNNVNRSCRISLSSTTSIQGTGAAITAQAAAKPAGDDSIRGSLATTAASAAYQDQLADPNSIANRSAVCSQRTQDDLADDGAVATCDGAQTVAFDAAAIDPSRSGCEESRACVRTEVITENFTTSCSRTFPLTGYSCIEVTPTLTCTVTEAWDDPFEPGAITSTCTPEQLATAVLISTDNRGCSDLRFNPIDVAWECYAWSWEEHYVLPDEVVREDCAASPSPLAGPFGPAICATEIFDVEAICQGEWFSRTLSAPECTISGVTPDGEDFYRELDYRSVAGCGYCTRMKMGYLCQAAPTAEEPGDTCATSDLDGCVLTSATPQSVEKGITITQLETYSCNRVRNRCMEWSKSDTCLPSDYAYGVDKMPVKEVEDEGNFEQMVMAVALASGTSQTMSETNPALPTIFTGKGMKCEKPLGFLTELVSNDCCKTNLQRTGGGRPLNSCKQEEVELAAARRAHHDVYIGKYCSKKVEFLFFSTCVEQTQTYCVFPGILARLVQVQGRQQLAAMAASGAAGAVSMPMNFSYYSPAMGQWGASVTGNGVTVVPWQHPSYCSSLEEAARVLADDPTALECPGQLISWFAVCEKVGGCGSLPVEPEAGSEDWHISSVDPLQTVKTALSRFAMVAGACNTDTSACAYTVSAWPAGVGGQAVVSKDFTFSIDSVPGDDDLGVEMINIGEVMLRSAAPAAGVTPGSIPPAISIEYSRDGGTTWNVLMVPTTIPNEFPIPGTSVILTGGCGAGTLLCEYRALGRVEVTAKSWGTPKRPDCSGFSMGQLAVLDLSKMDLTEFAATLKDKVMPEKAGSVGTSALAAGGQTVEAPVQLKTASIIPMQGFGPYTATLRVVGNYPGVFDDPAKNVDPINSVRVDWGDCSVPTWAVGDGGVPGGFTANHVYRVAEDPGMCDKFGPAGPDKGRTLFHKIVLTINSASGAHTVELETRNVFHDYTETVGQGDNPGGNTPEVIVAPKPGP